MKRMSVKRFIKEFSGAPLSVEDIAEIIVARVDKNTELFEMAENYLKTQQNLWEILDNEGFEVG